MKFFKIPQDVAARKDLTGNAKLVYGAIDDHIGDNRRGWPGERLIASEIGANRDTVAACIRQLERAGLLAVDRGGWGKSNQYRLVKPSEKPGQLPAEKLSEESGQSKDETGRKTPLAGKSDMPENPASLDANCPENPASSGDQLAEKSGHNNTKTNTKIKTNTIPPTVDKPKLKHHDLHADAFKAAFDAVHPQHYAWKPADFVQLSAWREEYPNVTPEEFAEVAKGNWALGMYCSKSAMTIKGLCADYSTCAIKAKNAKDGNNGQAQSGSNSGSRQAKGGHPNPHRYDNGF